MQSSNFEQILESSISETRFTSVSTELSRWGIFGTEGTLSWAVLEKKQIILYKSIQEVKAERRKKGEFKVRFSIEEKTPKSTKQTIFETPTS